MKLLFAIALLPFAAMASPLQALTNAHLLTVNPCL